MGRLKIVLVLVFSEGRGQQQCCPFFYKQLIMKIELSEKEVKLLMLVLTEAEETRSDMGCNDPYKNEESLFSKKERIAIYNQYFKEEEEESDGFLFNSQYVKYLMKQIKGQLKHNHEQNKKKNNSKKCYW